MNPSEFNALALAHVERDYLRAHAAETIHHVAVAARGEVVVYGTHRRPLARYRALPRGRWRVQVAPIDKGDPR